jgi:hypothetical protein
MVEDKDITPVGKPAPEPEPTETPAEPAEATPEKEPKEELLAGKFKTTEDLVKGYENSEELRGRQGNELGEARSNAARLEAENRLLKEQQASTPPAAQPAEELDYQAQKRELRRMRDDGELTIDEYEDARDELAAQMGADAAMLQVREAQVEANTEALMNQFVAANPDYLELQKSGALDDFMEANPLYRGDPIGAYPWVKLAVERADYEAKMAYIETAAAEGGRAEAERIAAGAANATQVLPASGKTIREVNVPTKPMTRRQRTESMMGAVEAERARKRE